VNKKKLIEDVLAGKEVEHPPVTLWYHFGVHHGSGERFAELALDYFFHYDFDFLKVMNDYYYPLPDGLERIKTAGDIEKLCLLTIEKTDWSEQLKALRVVGRKLRDEAYFIDTVFDPWHTFKRALAGENLERLMEDEPVATHRGLEIITENLIRYCKKAIAEGAAGIFLSIPAGEEMVSREQFLEFVKPYSKTLLEEIKSEALFNVAHVHGEKVYMDECLDLPAHVFNWWDRGPHGPSLSDVKGKINGCVMGGIDHTILPRHTLEFIRNHAREGKALGGNSRFILAGGCSISSSLPPRAIRVIVDEARR